MFGGFTIAFAYDVQFNRYLLVQTGRFDNDGLVVDTFFRLDSSPETYDFAQLHVRATVWYFGRAVAGERNGNVVRSVAGHHHRVHDFLN